MDGKRTIYWFLLVAVVAVASAMMILPLRAAKAQPLDPAAQVESRHSVRLEVDLSERKLYVYTDGSVMNTFDVAIGEEEHPTPTGDFTIDRIIWNPAWVPPNEPWAEGEERREPGDPENPMQAAKIFFEYPDYYIHGTNAPQTVGTAASHGCLRMREADVENLAEFIQKAGGADRGEAWFERVRASDTEKTEVELPSPVPISIRR